MKVIELKNSTKITMSVWGDWWHIRDASGESIANCFTVNRRNINYKINYLYEYSIFILSTTNRTKTKSINFIYLSSD